MRMNVANVDQVKKRKNMSYAIVIKGSDGNKEMLSDEVKARSECVRSKLSVRVKAIWKIRNDGLTIEIVNMKGR